MTEKVSTGCASRKTVSVSARYVVGSRKTWPVPGAPADSSHSHSPRRRPARPAGAARGQSGAGDSPACGRDTHDAARRYVRRSHHPSGRNRERIRPVRCLADVSHRDNKGRRASCGQRSRSLVSKHSPVKGLNIFDQGHGERLLLGRTPPPGGEAPGAHPPATSPSPLRLANPRAGPQAP